MNNLHDGFELIAASYYRKGMVNANTNFNVMSEMMNSKFINVFKKLWALIESSEFFQLTIPHKTSIVGSGSSKTVSTALWRSTLRVLQLFLSIFLVVSFDLFSLWSKKIYPGKIIIYLKIQVQFLSMIYFFNKSCPVGKWAVLEIN